MRGVLNRFLLSDALWWLLPTPGAAYFNRVRLNRPDDIPTLPKETWSQDARHKLLSDSEERLRSIEGKGPGLATVSAVIVGAALLALTSGWEESTAIGRAILVLAAMYGALSLMMPLYLAGPVARNAVHLADLRAAADAEDADESLATSAAVAAVANDLRNRRLTNLLDAARRELVYALVLLLLWSLLVPIAHAFRQGRAVGSKPTPPTPALMHAVAAATTDNALDRRLGRRWTHGSRKSITCRALAINAFDCTARWRYRNSQQGRVVTVSLLAGRLIIRVRSR